MALTKDELISEQAMEIANLKTELAEYKEMTHLIHCELYCIGSPLNGSKLQYTKEQLKPFFRIGTLLLEGEN